MYVPLNALTVLWAISLLPMSKSAHPFWGPTSLQIWCWPRIGPSPSNEQFLIQGQGHLLMSPPWQIQWQQIDLKHTYMSSWLFLDVIFHFNFFCNNSGRILECVLCYMNKCFCTINNLLVIIQVVQSSVQDTKNIYRVSVFNVLTPSMKYTCILHTGKYLPPFYFPNPVSWVK